jgi:hypothetical protein
MQEKSKRPGAADPGPLEIDHDESLSSEPSSTSPAPRKRINKRRPAERAHAVMLYDGQTLLATIEPDDDGHRWHVYVHGNAVGVLGSYAAAVRFANNIFVPGRRR